MGYTNDPLVVEHLNDLTDSLGHCYNNITCGSGYHFI